MSSHKIPEPGHVESALAPPFNGEDYERTIGLLISRQLLAEYEMVYSDSVEDFQTKRPVAANSERLRLLRREMARRMAAA